MYKNFARLTTIAVLLLGRLTYAATPAEACLTSDQSWTPPTGLTTVKRVVVVGAGAAGGADASGNFGAAGKSEPVGGSTAGTSWGGGGAGGVGAGGGGAGVVLDNANVPVAGTVAVKVGSPGATAGASGTQSCFGTSCAAGGTGGSGATDFSPAGGGQAGWGGASGTSQKNSTVQEFGTIYTGQVSSAKTITVVNNSGAATTMASISAPAGTVITNDACSGMSVPAGSSCTFKVALSPTVTGDLSVQLQVQSQRGKLTVPLHATVAPPPVCSLPWGGTINNGSSVTAYQSSSVPFGSSCSAQTRTCSNGTLSGSYTNQSCSVQPGASCSLPWGGAIAHGQSVTAYASSNVPYGSSCSSQTRSCYNGSLSGSYGSSSCSVAPPPSYNWQTVQIDYWSSAGNGSTGSCPSGVCYSPGSSQSCVSCGYIGSPASTPYSCTTYWVQCK